MLFAKVQKSSSHAVLSRNRALINGYNYGHNVICAIEIAKNAINAEVRQLNFNTLRIYQPLWRKSLKIFLLKVFGQKAFKAIRRLKAKLLLSKEGFMQRECDNYLTETMSPEYFSQYIDNAESKRKFLEFREANINLIPLKLGIMRL